MYCLPRDVELFSGIYPAIPVAKLRQAFWRLDALERLP